MEYSARHQAQVKVCVVWGVRQGGWEGSILSGCSGEIVSLWNKLCTGVLSVIINGRQIKTVVGLCVSTDTGNIGSACAVGKKSEASK